jgi:hypothetical protein
MSPEFPPSKPDKPNPFGFSEREQLWDRVSDTRLRAILRDEATHIHALSLDTNTFGEFLFVSVSRPGETHRVHVTFFGLGFHEGRDRWLTDEWFWYEGSARSQTLEQQRLSWEAAELVLNDRQAFVQGSAQQHRQSARGEVFDILADLTDEDGAWAEMDELSDGFDDEPDP